MGLSAFIAWVVIFGRSIGTPLCNRPSETQPTGFSPFPQWNFSLPVPGEIEILPDQFVASPVRLLHIQHIWFVNVWKRQNSDLTERGKLVENLPTRWRLFRKPGENIDATGFVPNGCIGIDESCPAVWVKPRVLTGWLTIPYSSNNQRLEKCVRCVLLLYNWYLRVFLADHLLQTWS